MLETVMRTTTPTETEQLANTLADCVALPARIFLSGELGAGKTCWVRALLRALGETGVIPSPSYALAHTYTLGELTVHHMDCFRLQGAALGDDLLELLDDEALCLVEWPEYATNLAAPDLWLYFNFVGETVRDIRFVANGDLMTAALRRLAV